MPDEVVSESPIKAQDDVQVPAPTPLSAVMEILIEPPLVLDLTSVTRRKTNVSTKLLITVNKNTRIRVNGVEL